MIKNHFEKGAKVVFLNRNGNEADHQHAEDLLVEGQVYTVREIVVLSWIVEVRLEEFTHRPRTTFNSAMFEEVRHERDT